MRSKITLKELAKLLNVSVSTVSKSLNDSSEISPKTVQRVKELAQLHNYRPNPTAVNLKRNRTGNIAVIVPNISNTFFAKVLGGVETEARKLGFQVITYISNESLKLEKQITELISNGLVDGLLISVSEETQKMGDYDHLHTLLEYEIPVVLFDRIITDIEIDMVGVNDKDSIYDAVQFLYSKNVKKIGLVCALGDIGLGQLRIDGYKAACKDLGLPVDKEYMVVSGEIPVVKEKLEKLLTEKEVEALIALDFLSTLLTSRTIQEQGMKIPEDIKMIGYANEDFASFLYPSLSYVDQHPMQMGETAASLLVDRIQGKKPSTPAHTILKTELKHLDSTRF
ncbi:MAG TPA: LacI family DNA-binding transcriptional regulator [Gillisia sp.]|nr:LacI family DNA-binding transcriptional regulator [Gillisia sp.]